MTGALHPTSDKLMRGRHSNRLAYVVCFIALALSLVCGVTAQENEAAPTQSFTPLINSRLDAERTSGEGTKQTWTVPNSFSAAVSSAGHRHPPTTAPQQAEARRKLMSEATVGEPQVTAFQGPSNVGPSQPSSQVAAEIAGHAPAPAAASGPGMCDVNITYYARRQQMDSTAFSGTFTLVPAPKVKRGAHCAPFTGACTHAAQVPTGQTWGNRATPRGAGSMPTAILLKQTRRVHHC